MTRIAPVAPKFVPIVATLLALAGQALAEPSEADRPPARSAIDGGLSYAEHEAADILSQPVRDVGLLGKDIPEPLQRASRDPYGLADSWSCADIGVEIAQLEGSLGPEPFMEGSPKESRFGKLAEAGGRAMVNSLVPFRTVVREVSGAAPAQRRLQAAIDIGYARRGFLRGVYRMRNCEPAPITAPDPKRPIG